MIWSYAIDVGMRYMSSALFRITESATHVSMPSFGGPLEREAILDEVVEIRPQHVLVELVVLEGPADEERPGVADQRSDREEVHVDAGGRVVRRHVVLPEEELKGEPVEVRSV